jgi:hypothetical protein
VKIYATMACYMLGRALGIDTAQQVLAKMMSAPLGADGEDQSTIEGVATLRQLSQIGDVECRVDAGATCIAKSRCRAFDAALKSDAEVWVSVDDDVLADAQTLAWLVGAVATTRPAVCVAPCLLRPGGGRPPTANVEFYSTVLTGVQVPLSCASDLCNDGLKRRIKRAGLGLFAINRAGLDELHFLATLYEHDGSSTVPTRYLDDDGVVRDRVFFDSLVENRTHPNANCRWLGEDLAFFEYLRHCARAWELDALVRGRTVHAGAELDLEQL